MGAPDSLSRGFHHPYQILFTLFDISIEFRWVKAVDSYTLQYINPNFRVGQLWIFVKIKVVFIMHFKQKYTFEKNLPCLIVRHCMSLIHPWDLIPLIRLMGSIAF